MKKYFLHSNGDAKNHGCEAIIRGSANIIDLNELNADYISYDSPNELQYGLDKIIKIISCSRDLPKNKSIDYYFTRFIEKFSPDYYSRRVVGCTIRKIENHSIAIALGGDNYCYAQSYKYLAYINKSIKKKGMKSVLWGVSIEPDILKLPDVQNDMQRYDMIYARESLTYNALIEAGITKNVFLSPDPAFALETIKLPLPDGFVENNTIGINVSPLIQSYEKGDNITLKNYFSLVQHIIDNTDFQIALIPHVVWSYNNDLETLNEIYQKFNTTGRVIVIGDHNCMELKGFIARCRMFIGARTHATIAAYSSMVPTLVVGYSVKARGIAKDIFGSHENYVIPVQSLQEETDLTNAFIWMQKNETSIKKHLNSFIPDYKKKVWEAGKAVNRLT